MMSIYGSQCSFKPPNPSAAIKLTSRFSCGNPSARPAAQQPQGPLLAKVCVLKTDDSFDENDLYAAMTQLSGRWVNMERALYQRPFAQSVRWVLYDLPRVYFEGKAPQGTSRYGHSRD